MVEIPYDNSDDRDKFVLLVGRCIRAWAELENSLWIFAASLLAVDQFRARIVMGSINNGRAQRELLIRLAETYMADEALPEFRNLMKRAKSLGDQRNMLAHSMMFIDSKSSENVAFRDHFNDPTVSGLAFKEIAFPLNKAKNLHTATKKLNQDVIRFASKISDKGLVHSSARIHREQSSDPTP